MGFIDHDYDVALHPVLEMLDSNANAVDTPDDNIVIPPNMDGSIMQS